MKENCRIPWPKKYDLFGVQVSATTYDESVALILQAAKQRMATITSFCAAHAIVTASRDRALLQKINTFHVIGPDGHPVRWALNLLYRAGLSDRVYGPELMLRICDRAAEEGVSVYLYGSSPAVIEKLRLKLIGLFPKLLIAGAESPPFRALTHEEDGAVVRMINESGAGIVFIGLGCPKQDHFAYDHREKIEAVQVCVGAAFDFHAELKKMAPVWMQRNGLEWLFRLLQEPGRLWRRYLVTNTLFIQKLLVQWLSHKIGSNGKPKKI